MDMTAPDPLPASYQQRPSAQLVSSQRDLDVAVAAIACSDRVAIDTEFMREQTYFPKLCLLQLAVDDAIWCVDPLADIDLGSLLEALFNPGRLKVGHAVRQDFEIFWHLRGAVPCPVFDTQLAAMLCGFPDQIGYAALVRDLFAVDLDKSHTRTDWARRPLSAAQLDYAAADVRFLEPMRQELGRRLGELGRLSWLDEECERLASPETFDGDDGQLWLRLKGAASLDHAGRRALKALVCWRESLARQFDRPRRWIISDEDLLFLAGQRPKTVSELRANGGIAKNLLQRHGERMVTLIGEAECDETFDDSALERLACLPRARVKGAIEFVQARCAEAGLVPQAVASKRDIELLLAGEPGGRLQSGWRRELVGDSLSNL